MIEITPVYENSDLLVTNAARVSFAKKKEVFDEKDLRLLSYLWEHKHWSPFAHGHLLFQTNIRAFGDFDSSTSPGQRTMSFMNIVANQGPGLRLQMGAQGDVMLAMSLYWALKNWNYLTYNMQCECFKRFPQSVTVASRIIDPRVRPERFALFIDSMSQSKTGSVKEELESAEAFHGEAARYLNPDDLENLIPSALPTLTFHVKAPIFVARQVMKHQHELVVNEVSRRYVDNEPQMFQPLAWRERVADKKQGSGNELTRPGQEDADSIKKIADTIAKEAYGRLLYADVAPEQARMVLPQSMMTEWYWTGSLRAFLRVIDQRSSKDGPQQEARDFAYLLLSALLKSTGRLGIDSIKR